MKKFHRLTALGLALAMLFSLTALALDTAAEPCPSCGEYHDTYPDDFDYDAWYQEYLKEQEARLRQEKINMGYFFPDGVNILLNEKPLNVPVVYFEEGFSMVAVTAFFPAAGGNYNLANNSASLGGTRVYFTPGSATVTSSAGGEPLQLGTPTRVENGILYASVRDLADLFGLDIYWDDYYRVIELYDYESFAKEIDKDFTIVNQYLAANKIDYTQAIELLSQLNASGTLYGDGKSYTGHLEAGVTGVVKGADGDFSGKLSFDITQFKHQISELPSLAALLPYAEKPYEIPFRYIVNSQDSKAYFQSDEVTNLYVKYNELPQDKSGQNVWFSLYNPVSGNLLQDPMPLTVGTLFADLYEHSYYFDHSTLTSFYVFFADDAFAKSGSNYTAKMGTLELAKRMEQYGASSWDMAQLEGLPQFKYELVLTENSPTNMSARIDLSLRMWSLNPTEIKVTGQLSGLKGNATISVKGDYVGKLEISTTSDIKNTTKAPAGQPPEGSVIADDLYYEW